MKFEIHHHHHPDKELADRLCWVIRGIGALIRNQKINQENIMSSFDDLKAAQAATDTAVATIKTDVETLLAKLAAIPVAGMTPDQQAALDDAVKHATSINASLSSVDATVNPAPAPAA